MEYGGWRSLSFSDVYDYAGILYPIATVAEPINLIQIYQDTTKRGSRLFENQAPPGNQK